jgi:hypothetical protein
VRAVANVIDSGQRIGRYQTDPAPGRRRHGRDLPRPPARVGIEGFEKLVVLKRILPQHALDPELLRMFLDEARLSATLTHPHVIEVYDVGAETDAPFFAMEYVHGANVREMLRAQGRAAGNVNKASAPLPLAHAVTIVAAAAEGLHYAHERLGPGGEPLGIVHRDVSPSNVLVSYDGAVKVSDFGIAKWAFQRTRTQEGTLKGKFAYMSPSSAARGPSTAQRHLRAGRDPLRADDGQRAVRGRQRAGHPEPDRDRRASPPRWPEAMGAYPPALSEIVLRALAPEADDRFPTMQALQIAIESFARASGSRCRRWRWRRTCRVVRRRARGLAGRSARGQVAGRTPGGEAGCGGVRGCRRTHRHRRVRNHQAARAPARRVARYAAVAGFVGLCAIAGGALAKRWMGDAGAPAVAGEGSKITPRSVAPGAERNPATEPTAEKTMPSSTAIPAVRRAMPPPRRPRPRPRRR